MQGNAALLCGYSPQVNPGMRYLRRVPRQRYAIVLQRCHMPAIRIGLAEMTYTTMPDEDPARHAWAVVEVLLGEPLELTFVEDGDGDRLGFWRCRFYSD
jgi:hypothetical protein